MPSIRKFQRLLIFASRGITYRDRHLMNSFRTMLAHSKEECKFEKKDSLLAINEVAEMKNCNKVRLQPVGHSRFQNRIFFIIMSSIII